MSELTPEEVVRFEAVVACCHETDNDDCSMCPHYGQSISVCLDNAEKPLLAYYRAECAEQTARAEAAEAKLEAVREFAQRVHSDEAFYGYQPAINQVLSILDAEAQCGCKREIS